MSDEQLCACGKPLHYTNQKLRGLVQQQVDSMGENIKVAARGKAYMVPRHYIALHGLKGWELAELGFPEAPDDRP